MMDFEARNFDLIAFVHVQSILGFVDDVCHVWRKLSCVCGEWVKAFLEVVLISGGGAARGLLTICVNLDRSDRGDASLLVK